MVVGAAAVVLGACTLAHGAHTQLSLVGLSHLSSKVGRLGSSRVLVERVLKINYKLDVMGPFGMLIAKNSPLELLAFGHSVFSRISFLCLSLMDPFGLPIVEDRPLELLPF